MPPIKTILFTLLLLLFSQPEIYAQRLYDGRGKYIGRVYSDRFYDGSGKMIGRVQNDRVYEDSGRLIARADGLSNKEIILFFYFYR